VKNWYLAEMPNAVDRGPGSNQAEEAVADGVAAAREKLNRLSDEVQVRYKRVSKDVRRGAARAAKAAKDVRRGAARAAEQVQSVVEHRAAKEILILLGVLLLLVGLTGSTLRVRSSALRRKRHRVPRGSSRRDDAVRIFQSTRSGMRVLDILSSTFPSQDGMLNWLTHPHPDLGGKTPMQVAEMGHTGAVERMLEAALIGLPS
jgi:hypothetical protein